jgi:hypothetical protein
MLINQILLNVPRPELRQFPQHLGPSSGDSELDIADRVVDAGDPQQHWKD